MLTTVGGIFAGVCASLLLAEARARIDDLPKVMVGLAARRLPAAVRDDYLIDWESNLLVALNDSTARYPLTRFIKSLRFGASLLFTTRRVRREIRRAERAERKLRTRPSRRGRHVVVRPATATLTISGGPVDASLTGTGTLTASATVAGPPDWTPHDARHVAAAVSFDVTQAPDAAEARLGSNYGHCQLEVVWTFC